MNVLINSTVLSNFAATKRLSLLHALYGHDLLALSEANQLLSQMETLARYHSPVKKIDSLLN